MACFLRLSRFYFVLAFAVSMLVENPYFSYLASFFIALLFRCCVRLPRRRRESEGQQPFLGGACSAVYATFICLVYFAQMTLDFSSLGEIAAELLDYQRLGRLFFHYDLLGYAFMALATFFIGLTLTDTGTCVARALKALLMLHGVFAISCIAMPLLGVFQAQAEGSAMFGIIALECWCACFVPVCTLAFFHFRGLEEAT